MQPLFGTYFDMMKLNEIVGQIFCNCMHCIICVTGCAAVCLYLQEINIKTEEVRKIYERIIY
jgi:hypothetical protein